MNDKAIKELYYKAYSEPMSEMNAADAVELQKIKKEAEEKLSYIMSKASSADTKENLLDLVKLYQKAAELTQLNSFVLGFRKGAQLMSNLV